MRARVPAVAAAGVLAVAAALGWASDDAPRDAAGDLRAAVVRDDRGGWERALPRVDDVDDAPLGVTALHMAARLGRLDAVVALLDAGADVDLAQPDGDAAVHLAVVARSPEAVRLLLAAGANPDLPGSERGGTPAHLAATLNDVQALAALADAGADLEALRPNGVSPVVAAACVGSADAVAWLVARGVGVAGRGGHAQRVPSALECARVGGHDHVVAILVTGD